MKLYLYIPIILQESLNMEKHISLVGVLNIVYRAWTMIWGFVLLVIAAGFDTIMYYLSRERHLHLHEVPDFVFELIPYILTGFGILIILVSVVGIIAAIGVLKLREWARILMLIVSFFNLLRFPLGTILGAYSIWVLMKDETIQAFNPPART